MLVCSCEKEEQDGTGKTVPVWKEYLIYAESRDMLIRSITTTQTATSVLFMDGSSIDIPSSEQRVEDYSSSTMPVWEVVGGCWFKDGEDTGIVVRSGQSKVSSPIVFAGYDTKVLELAFASGDVLSLPLLGGLEKRLPAIRLTTDSGRAITSKTNYVHGTISVEDPTMTYSEMEFYSGDMWIRGRGNSTWNRPKKPYKIKLEENAGLLGMPSDKEWCLLADYYDRTLVRNLTAMELSRICGMSWTPRMAKVDVWLNGEYVGVYTFCEHKKVDKYRVNIAPTDCYLSIDEVQDKPFHFMTSMNIPVEFDEPEMPESSQYLFIVSYFKSFESALQGKDFKDPEKGYAAWIDVPSFVNYYIIQELAKNIDGNTRRSTFVTKESGKKLEMYHVWDFDLAFGNCNYFSKEFPGSDNGYTGFYIRDFNQYYKMYTGWYYRLFQDPAFVQKVKDRWNELKPQFETIPDYIDSQIALMGPSVKNNFQRWPVLSETFSSPSRFSDFSGHVSYFKVFYSKRLNWLDKELNAL